MAAVVWTIGQEVNVAPRTWPGINKPGGHGKIVKIHYSSLGVVDGLDVKYTLQRTVDTNLEEDLVTPHFDLQRGRRSRRGRNFLTMNQPLPKKKKLSPKEMKPSVKAVKVDCDEEKENRLEASNKTKSKSHSNKMTKSEPDALKCLKKENYSLDASSRTAISNSPVASMASSPLQSSWGSTTDVQTTPLPDTKPSSTTVPFRFVRASEALVSPLPGGNKNEGYREHKVFSNNSTLNEDNNTSSTTSKPQQKNTAAAVIPKMGPVSTAGRGTLKSSYERDLKQQKPFIEELNVQPKTKGAEPTALNASTKPAPRRVVLSGSQRRHEERYQLFTSLFNKASSQRTEGIPMGKLRDMVNPSGSPTVAFSDNEVQTYIDQMCGQDKAMESDGAYFALS